MQTEYLRFSKERREAYNNYLKTLDVFRKTERKEGRRTWAIYDASLEDFSDDDSFMQDFSTLVPDGMSLEGFVREKLSGRESKLVGLELGGPGSRCFAGFQNGSFKLTAGVTLRDLRDKDEKVLDKLGNHHVVEFDISNPLLEQELKRKLGVDKAHFIIERMTGGLPDSLRDPYFIYQVGNRWYHLLETPGVMFIQCPRSIHKIMPSWESKVKATTNNAIEACYFRRKSDRGVLRILKKDGAPEDLPFLTPREIRVAFTA